MALARTVGQGHETPKDAQRSAASALARTINRKRRPSLAQASAGEKVLAAARKKGFRPLVLETV
jgi:hypothetical protein